MSVSISISLPPSTVDAIRTLADSDDSSNIASLLDDATISSQVTPAVVSAVMALRRRRERKVMHAFRLHVVNLMDGAEIVLQVQGSTYLSDVKEMIEEKCGMKPFDQRLICGEGMGLMNDVRTCSEYGLKDGSVVHIVQSNWLATARKLMGYAGCDFVNAKAVSV